MRIWFGYDDSGTLRSMELRHMGWKPEVDFNASVCPPGIDELKAQRAAVHGINHWIVHECGCPSTAPNCVCHNTVMHGFFVENGLLVPKSVAVLKVNDAAVEVGATIPIGVSVSLSVESNVPDGSKIVVAVTRALQQETAELTVTDGKTPAHLFQNLPIGYCRMGCTGTRIKGVSLTGLRNP